MDGAFNGDPHPGNILLMPDGKLGLIDYGQVGTQSRAEQSRFASRGCDLCCYIVEACRERPADSDRQPTPRTLHLPLPSSQQWSYFAVLSALCLEDCLLTVHGKLVAWTSAALVVL